MSDFSRQEFTQIQENVKGAWLTVQGYTPSGWEMEGNEIHGYFAPHGTGEFTMTEEELEILACATMQKIPYADGEYEYSGIRGRDTLIGPDSTITTAVIVSFYPVLDGLRVIGDNRCDMWFNDSGLVQIHIERYAYHQIGTMDVVSVEDAGARVKSPDVFIIDEDSGAIETLRVEQINLRLVNQYSNGCAILQPLYAFKGMAMTIEGTEKEFSSRVIAIPEKYTYEAE